MTRRFSILVALGAALLLGACQTETASKRSFQPIPAKTLSLMAEKGMTRRDPILVRIFKEESELEVWKRNSSGRYALLKTYEICRWSGTLGPKIAEGDGQSPEGFYSVGPAQMNPNSQYYLSFNLGFPNAFDKAHGRTGSHLMVHGDCLSRGCYAMTDPQIAEVYAIAREALNAGQPKFQVQAFPFRMTAQNMARRRDNKNFAFWENLKEGYDHFELTKLEPKVDVCERRYVFNAQAQDAAFNPGGACPAYEVTPSIAMAYAAKKRQDAATFEDLVSKGLQTAEAYVPQNGRVRRSLNEPIRRPAPEPVMTASAPSTTAAASGGSALALTSGSVPMPIPSPYATAQAPRKQGGAAFSWLRGNEGQSRPSELTTASTPASNASATPASPAATASVSTAPGPRAERPAQTVSSVPEPVAASIAPPAEKKPFYKRLLGFGG